MLQIVMDSRSREMLWHGGEGTCVAINEDVGNFGWIQACFFKETLTKKIIRLLVFRLGNTENERPKPAPYISMVILSKHCESQTPKNQPLMIRLVGAISNDNNFGTFCHVAHRRLQVGRLIKDKPNFIAGHFGGGIVVHTYWLRRVVQEGLQHLHHVDTKLRLFFQVSVPGAIQGTRPWDVCFGNVVSDHLLLCQRTRKMTVLALQDALLHLKVDCKPFILTATNFPKA